MLSNYKTSVKLISVFFTLLSIMILFCDSDLLMRHHSLTQNNKLQELQLISYSYTRTEELSDILSYGAFYYEIISNSFSKLYQKISLFSEALLAEEDNNIAPQTLKYSYISMLCLPFIAIFLLGVILVGKLSPFRVNIITIGCLIMLTIPSIYFLYNFTFTEKKPIAESFITIELLSGYEKILAYATVNALIFLLVYSFICLFIKDEEF